MPEKTGGKYESEAQAIMDKTGAGVVLLLVIGGDRGNGFTVLSKMAICDVDVAHNLRRLADNIERGQDA